MSEPYTNSESTTVTIAAANTGKDNWEWKCLLSTFNKARWQIRNHRLALIVFGEEFGFDRDAAVDVQFVGVTSLERTEQILSSAQIMYCSQRFEPKFAGHARSYVPPELSLFLKSGRPLVFHGPEYAAPVELLKSKNAAAFCHCCELVNVELYNCFDRLLFDKEYYAELATNGLHAAEDALIANISQEQISRCIKAND